MTRCTSQVYWRTKREPSLGSCASDLGVQVGISTGSLARYPRGSDPIALAGYLADVDADAVEILFYRSFHDDLERTQRAFLSCGKPVLVVHAEKNLGSAFGSSDAAEVADGQRRFMAALRLAEQLGARLITLHLWDRPESDRNLERNLDALEPLLQRVLDVGMVVGLETIPCTISNPVDNVRNALKHFGGLNSGCAVTLDLEFLGWHDCIDRADNSSFQDLDSQVADVHVRDYDGRPFTEEGRRRYLDPGQGNLDFRAIFQTLLAGGFRGPFMYEGSHTPVSSDGDVALINTVLADMRRLISGVDGTQDRN